MSALIRLVSRFGDAVDELVAAVPSVPRFLRDALGTRRRRLGAAAVAFVYLIVYLFALGDIDVSLAGAFSRFADIPSVNVVSDWPSRLFEERAPFLYEPVATIFLLPQLAFFVSVGDILIGSGLGIMLALNGVLAVHAAALVATCRRRNVFTSALGVLPTFLMGFACCAPTLLLALGANIAAATVSIVVPLRSFILPAALALMGAMIMWSARRLLVAEREIAALQSAPERAASKAA